MAEVPRPARAMGGRAMTGLDELLGGDVVIGLWTIGLAILASVPCAILGTYLVLRRMSMLGDAISHAVLPGIAIGFLLSGQLIGPAIVAGAMVVGVLTALLSRGLSGIARVPEDAGMGVVFTSFFAVGVLIITNAARDVDLDPGCVLYGLIELAALDTVSIGAGGFEVPRSLASLGTATGLTVAFVGLLWKELKLTSFDPALATAVGLNAGWVHYALMAMVAGVAVASFEAVGSILVVAMLIVPASAGHLLSDRLGRMMAWAVAVAVASSVLGYLVAVALNTSVSGSMSVVSGVLFGLAVLLAPRHGLVSKLGHRLALGMRISREDVLARLYRAREAGDATGLSIAECRRWASLAGTPLAGRLALVQLRSKGLVSRAADGRVTLTVAGLLAARELVAAHRLWESYLDRNFHLPADHLHDPAERLEHYLGPELIRSLSEDLERPAADPHGRVIPETAGGGGDEVQP